MSQEGVNRKWMPLIIGLILVLLISGLGVGTGGGGSTPICDNQPQINANNTCPAITFDSIASNSLATSCPCSITATITATFGDFLVVFASSENQGNAATVNITSVTDTQLDSFTLAIHTYVKNTSFCCSSDFWTATMSASSTTVTVNWGDSSGQQIGLTLFVAAYKNAGSVGTIASQCESTSGTGMPPCIAPSQMGNFTMITKKTGSVIVGGTALESSFSSPPCSKNYLVAGNNLTQKGAVCLIATDNMQADFEDNAQASYSNGFPFFYSTSWVTPDPPFGEIQDSTTQAIELLPNFFNGPNVAVMDTDPFCPTSGSTCHINFVSKASGPTAANKALALNTAYCTGITTAALTTTGGSVEVWASYTGDSLNTTGLKLYIQAAISTSAPSTVFGVGQCTAVFTQVGRADLYFPISGALSSTNEFSIAINGFATPAAGTWYAWLEITAQNFAVGSAGFTQVPTVGPATITMAELK